MDESLSLLMAKFRTLNIKMEKKGIENIENEQKSAKITKRRMILSKISQLEN